MLQMSDVQQLPLFVQTDKISRFTPLAQTIPAFREYLRKEGKSQNTIKAFTSDLHLMCQFYGDEQRIDKLGTKDLNRFLHWLEHGRGQPCSRKSYARRVTTLKVYFKWLKIIKVRSDNPSVAIVQRSGPAPLQSILHYDEIQQLLEHTGALRFAEKPDARPDLLVRLLLDTGIKKAECMNITLDAIDRSDPDHPILKVRHRSRQNQFKERRVALEATWLDVLDDYVAQYEVKSHLFTCTPRNLEYVLRDAETASGIGSKVSFEILRWTSAVHDYLNGMDLDALREKLGLSRISWRETSQKIMKLADKERTRR